MQETRNEKTTPKEKPKSLKQGAKNAVSSFAVVRTGPNSKKKKNLPSSTSSMSGSERFGPIRIWVRIAGEDYDSVPIIVDASSTVHELKLKLQRDENFDLDAIKLYLFKLYKGNSALDPKCNLWELIDDGDEIEIKVGQPIVPSQMDGTLTPNKSPFTPRSTRNSTPVGSALNTMDEVLVGSLTKTLKKDIVKLKKELTEIKEKDNSAIYDTLTSRLEDIEASNAQRHKDFMAALSPRVPDQNSAPRHSVQGLGPLGPTTGFPAANEMARGLPTIKPKETLTDHKGPIQCLAVTDDYLYSGSVDTTIKMWELNTLKVKHTFQGHTKQVTAIAKSNDGKLLASGSSDCTVKLWDTESLNVMHSFNTNKDISSLCMYRGHIYSGHLKTVMVWDIKKQKQLAELTSHDHWVRAITVANGYFFTGAKSIQVWDISTLKLMRTIDLSQLRCGSIYCMGVYNNMVLAGTYQQIVTLWDMRSYEYSGAMKHPAAVYALAVHENKLFTGCYDHVVYEWDMRRLQYPQKLYVGHLATVDALCTHNDKLFSGSNDNTIKTWKFN